MIIGAVPGIAFAEQRVTLAPGSSLFVFSDGCYELFTPGRTLMSLEDFAAILASAAPHPDALDRTIAASRQWQQREDFEDDFSLIQFHL